MSCNGCRVLRKGCSETCVLRHCLQCIDSPEAQAHATLFVTKFFGRAGLTGFINGVPEHQRPALFQSLLYEACGRTVNPVYGAVGLLFSGNWAVCQAAVERVLRGGSPKPAVSTISVATLPATTAAAPFNSLSAAIDRAAGPISTNERHCRIDHITKSSDPSCHNINPESLQPLPIIEQSFVTSACSLKANSCHANPNILLDFSNVSGSSSADQDTTTVLQPHFNKRPIRDWISESMNASNKDAMSLKRARLNLPAPSDHHHDVAHTATIHPSVTSWIAGFKNVNQRSAGSAVCSLLADADCQQASAVSADRVHDAASEGQVRHVPLHRPTMQRRTHDLLVAPVARRVYYTPQAAGKHLMLQEKINGEIQGLHQESTVPLNRFSSVECDDIRGQTLLSKAEDRVESMISSDGVDDDECGNIAISAKLDLSLKSHQSPLCCQQGVEELNTTVSLQQLEREFVKQDQEPQELWRVSSPSVNSEGSVNNTIVDARDILRRSSGFNNARDSPPKDGVKLLNLLL